MATKIPHMWLDKHPLVHEDHAGDLETSAAVNEFHKGMPRSEAEKAAYDEYVKDHRLKAAAHHLVGMRAAEAAGATEEAQKHHFQYDQHLKSLGMEAIGAVPPEVEAKLKSLDHKAPYKFKSHGADAFGQAFHDQGQASLNKAESRQCQWKLGERRCKRFTVSKYCHAHKKHDD